MKNLLWAAGLLALATACTKEKAPEAVQETTTENTVVKTDSAVAETAVAPMENPDAIRVEPIAESADFGKTIFTQNGKVVIAFNTESQKGNIKIDGKEYPLNKLTFSENNYEIKGGGVTVTAENGDFKEMVSDCAYGTFPKIMVNLNGKTAELHDVKVQDCPNY